MRWLWGFVAVLVGCGGLSDFDGTLKVELARPGTDVEFWLVPRDGTCPSASGTAYVDDQALGAVEIGPTTDDNGADVCGTSPAWSSLAQLALPADEVTTRFRVLGDTTVAFTANHIVDGTFSSTLRIGSPSLVTWSHPEDMVTNVQLTYVTADGSTGFGMESPDVVTPVPNLPKQLQLQGATISFVVPSTIPAGSGTLSLWADVVSGSAKGCSGIPHCEYVVHATKWQFAVTIAPM